MFAEFVRQDSGQDLVEYSLLTAVLALGLTTAVRLAIVAGPVYLLNLIGTTFDVTAEPIAKALPSQGGGSSGTWFLAAAGVLATVIIIKLLTKRK